MHCRYKILNDVTPGAWAMQMTSEIIEECLRDPGEN